MNGSRSFGVCLCAAMPVLLLLASCPNPIDASLANKVEDTIPPVITILSPDPQQKNYFGSEVTITGTVADFADSAGRVEGSVQSVTYEEQYNKRINGSVTLDDDGGFSFSFSTIDPDNILSGTQIIVLTAVDWNGNSATALVTLYDKTSGPIIIVFDHGPTDYNVYSSALDAAFTITGQVELPTTILTYDVEPAVGPMISDQPIAWDPETGYFQFPFNPVDAGVSGQLRFILKAFDGKDSSTVFILTDDPVAPRLTSGTVASDNSSVNLQFSEGIYHAGAADPLSADLSLVFTKAGGTAENTVATGLLGAPAGGATSLDLGILVTGQPSGAETITVTGTLTDRVGNPLAPLYDSVTLNLKDKTAPRVVQVSSTLAAGSAHKAGAVVPVTVLFSEPVTVSSALALTLNVGASATCSAGTGSSLTLNYTVQAGHNVDPLNYTDADALTGAAADLEGNPAVLTLPDPASAEALAARDLCIDTIAPAAPVLQILDGGDELINKAENEDPAGVPFSVEGEAGATYDLSLANCTLITGTDPGTLPAAGFALRASASGIFTVTVSTTQTDRAGNVSANGSDTSQANLTVPNPPNVTTPGANPTNNLTPTWQWTSGGGGGGGYRYHLDLEAWTETAGTSYTPLTALGAGSHTLYVQERNAVGNWSASGSLAILIDLTPPNSAAVSLDDGGDGWINIAENGAGVPFSVTGESGATYAIALGNATLISGSASGTLPAAGFALQAGAEGTVSITVTLTDPAGNSSVFPGTASSEADLQAPGAPTVTVTEDPPDNKKPTWNWSSGGGGNGTYRRKLDDSGTEVQTTLLQYTPSTNLPAGTHILHVRERDAAGNWSEYGDSPAVTTT